MVLFYAFTAEGKKYIIYKYFIVVKTVRERNWEEKKISGRMGREKSKDFL